MPPPQPEVTTCCSVFLLCALIMLTWPAPSHAWVDFECVFGDIITAAPPDGEGHAMSFCPTRMDPPFMKRGDFIWAYDARGRCYECVCEHDLGLACCECAKVKGRKA